MPSIKSPFAWRFAPSEAELATGECAAIGIPVPSLAPFKIGEVEAARGDHSQAIHGAKSIEYLWDVLGEGQLVVYDELLTYDPLFVTFYYRGRWIDASGKPWQPLEQEPIGPFVGLVGRPGETNVRLRVTALTILNDPSLYTTD